MTNQTESSTISRANNRRFTDKVSQQWLFFSGNCTPVTKYLASRSYNSSWAPLKFLDALFRGYGQVVFANNPISGFMIFIALTVSDPVVSATGFLTASVGLLTSILVIPQPSDVIGQGLTVFNSLLIGLITAAALPTHYGVDMQVSHWFFLMIASIISVYVTSAFANILGHLCRYPLPYLTVPFNIIQPLLFLLIVGVNPLNTSDASSLTPHHTTPQPVPFVLSSLLSVDNLNSDYEPLTQTSISSTMVSTKHRNNYEDINLAKILNENVNANKDAFDNKVAQNHKDNRGTRNSHDITLKTDENLESESNFDSAQAISEIATESEDFNIRNSSRSNESQSNGVYTPLLNTVLDDSATEKLPSATDLPHLQQNSEVDSSIDVVNATEIPQVENKEVRDPEIFLNVVSDGKDSSTTQVSPSYSTTTANDANEEYSDPDWGTTEETEINIRMERNVLTEDIAENPVHLYNNGSNGVVEPVLDWGGVFSGIVLSMSQVFASNYAPASVLMYLAVVIYSPIMALFAVLGAILGTLTGVLLTDADTYASTGGVYDGTWGFNGLLSSMCLGGLFFVVNWPAALAAILNSIFATVIFHVLIPPFAQSDLSPLSLPFNLSSLLFLCVTSSGALIRPKAISFPEKHRRDYKQHTCSQDTEEEFPSSSDNDKDSEMEKKPSLTEVV